MFAVVFLTNDYSSVDRPFMDPRTEVHGVRIFTNKAEAEEAAYEWWASGAVDVDQGIMFGDEHEASIHEV